MVYTPPANTSYNAEPTDPDEALATELREGSVQMAAASDSIASALAEAKKVVSEQPSDYKPAAQDIADFLDDAGESIAEAASEPPTLEDVKRNFAVADDQRKQRIKDANDAYISMEQAIGTIETIPADVPGFDQLGDLITLAMDDLGDAIEAYGGKVETQAEDTASEPPAADGK